MIELRVSLRSKAEWDRWVSENAEHFAGWCSQVVTAAEDQGLREPITGIQRPAGTVRIDPDNLRESLSAGEMNSRKRAALLLLEMAYARIQHNGTRRPKVLGTEALTRVGRVLRGAWSHYLATEYLPTESDRAKHFPVVHLDLAQIQYPTETFDLFHGADIFKTPTNSFKALREVARVLRPGGVAIFTLPFLPTQQTSKMQAAFVIAQAGWDILDLCRQAGFADATMTLVISSTYGITGNSPPGIFVVSARKPEFATVTRPEAEPIPDMMYSGPELRKVIGLMALPRSGTTLLSSILGVHSQVKAVYEPWNSRKTSGVPVEATLSNFYEVFPTSIEKETVLLVKETATHLEFIDGLTGLLRSVELPFSKHLIFLLRNPFHVFVSEVEARRSWWGEGDLECNAEVFDRWADRSISALQRIINLASEFNTIFVSYEALVSRTQATLEALMAELQEPLELAQLHFETHVKLADVRGDNNVARNPQEISPDAMNRRAHQAIQLELLKGDSRRWAEIRQIADVFRDLESPGVLQIGSPRADMMVKSLRSIFAPGSVAETV